MKKLIVQKKNFLCILFFLFLPSLALLPAKKEPVKDKQPKSDEPQTLVEHLANVNLRSISHKDENFSSNSFAEYMNWHLKKTLYPHPIFRRDFAFKFLTKQEKKGDQAQQPFEKNKVKTWENLELFCALSGIGTYVAQAIDRTQTEIGKVALYHLLSTPTTNTTKLEKRQQVIQNLMQNKKLMQKLNSLFFKMHDADGPMLVLWDDDYFRHNLERYYFDIPGIKILNSSPNAILVKNAWDRGLQIIDSYLMGVAAITLLSYGVLSAVTNVSDRLKKRAEEYKGSGPMLFSYLWKIKNPKSFHSIVALLIGYFCAIFTKSSIRWTLNNFLLEKVAHTLANKQAQYLVSCIEIYKEIKNNPTLKEFDELKPIFDFFETTIKNQSELNELMSLVASETFKETPSIFSHKGKVLRMYSLLYDLIEKIESMLFAVGKLEAYYSCAKLCKEFETKRVKFCFATYEQAKKPFIKAHRFWHPLITTDTVVPNTITVGTDNHRPNMVLTGPNAGGKSCIIKSLALCLFTAQTIGIAPAESLTFTPFHSISTYLNITDDINSSNSLFKAEVKRAQNLITTLEKSEPQNFYFLVFDEIFNGTSFIEGAAAAYGCAKYLGKFPNSVTVVATHFSIITKLEKETNTYSNYKVSVIKNSNGITYPYKLKPGISNQHVALDILQNDGFHGSILDEAITIIEELSQ